MRISPTSLIRLACGALLLCSMSSFSGCEKTNVSPNAGKDCKKTTTTATDTTTATGAN